MVKILTVCRAGLVRSVSLANVLKLHFWPVDVLPGVCILAVKNNLDRMAIYLGKKLESEVRK